MKKKPNLRCIKKLLLILFALMLSGAIIFASPVWGGDWIDHGGDWGGSSDSNLSGDFDSDWDNDSSGGIFFFGGDSGSGGSSFISAFAIVVVIIIVLVIISASKKSSHRSNSSKGGYSSSPLHMSDTSSVNRQSIEKLKEIDPNFSEAAMLSKAENMFTTMQIAWCNLDYEPVRPFLSNALFEQQSKQLKDKIARDEKNISSEIAVLQSKLESFSSDGHTDSLNVWMRVKMKDYIVRISDPSKIVTGDPSRVYYLDFRWQFTRTSGKITDAETDAVKTGECPYCGANINMNQSGKCEYCGSVISTTEYDWVLSKIDALQQRSR